MADNVTAGGNTISTEEVTTLNGAAVSAQQVQRVASAYRSADGTVVDGVSLATAIAGEDTTNDVLRVQQRYTFTHISTATTTVVKTGIGILNSIIVQGGTTGTIIVYDNTAASGTIIASFDTTNAIASYAFNTEFATGLTVITAAATKLTLVYS